MIRRLELHNFATHEDTEIQFENNKNVIIGQTGSGKTNLLQAIDFAFLGSEQGTNLEELIADGAGSAEVILDYLDQRTNQNYRIHRTLTLKDDGGATHDCSITNLETNEIIRKPEPVRRTLEALEVENSVFRYVVHVPQGKFADVLQEGQDHKTALDRLFKVVQLEEAHRELGSQEGPIGRIEVRKQANVLEKTRLEADASKLAQEETLYQKLTQGRDTQQQKLNETRREHERLTRIAPTVEAHIETIDDLDSKISVAGASGQNSQRVISTLLSQLQGVISDERVSMIKSLNAGATATEAKMLETELTNLTTERDTLDTQYGESMKKTASAESHYNEVVRQKASLDGQITDIRSYLDGKGKQPEIQCDKCGSILTEEQWARHTDDIKSKLGEIEKEVGTAKQQWDNETVTEAAIHERLGFAKLRLENQAKDFGVISQLATQREIAEKSEASKNQLLEERQRAMNQLRSFHETQVESDDDILQKARTIKVQLESLLEQIEDAQRILTSYDVDVLAPQARRVETAKAADKQAKELQPQIDLDIKKVEILQTIRTAFRDIQPAVRRSFVARITASANDYLKRLYGGAEIENFEFSEDYEFLVTRAGHKRHANRLSGGQQVLASMAFLMALSEVLSELDFLILDEPTTHLDENRRKELVNVLENLRRVPQLIIVDHHPELLAAADTRFQVTLDSDGISKVSEIVAS
jgi:exonuclease SbcC